jgi:two-component system response regulator YesN
MSTLVRICNQMKLDISEMLSDSDLSGEVLDYFDNLTEVSSYLYTTIVTALKIELHEAQKCSNIVEMIIHYVDSNYEKNFTVKDIAYQFAINPNYFSMLFKKAKGQGFIEYVNSRKIDAACKLLLSTSTKSVTEIAESLGFGDVQYFFKLFKRMKGLTPLEYKRAQIK